MDFPFPEGVMVKSIERKQIKITATPNKMFYIPLRTCSPDSIALFVAAFALSAIDPVADCTPSPLITGLLLAQPILGVNA